MSINISDDQSLREKCAVFGVYGASEAARLAFYGLWALQHRGQESSGIASSDGKKLHRHTGFGLVSNVYKDEDLDELPGTLAIGHNRYSTSGGTDTYFNQPVMSSAGDNQFAYAHNGNLPDWTKLAAFLEKRGVDTTKLNDSLMMSKAIECYLDEGLALEQAIIKSYPLFTGVFSSIALDAHKLIAFRDECGIRPLAIGTLPEGGFVVASETCALDTVGATYLREVEPGELVVIDENGLTAHQVVKPNPKLDIFEFVYFARPDSVLLGRNIHHVRENLGRQMAKEFPIDADIVVPVPDSGIPAALGYSQGTGMRFEMGLIKNRYINRTFIRPTAELRKRDLKMKLNPIVGSIKGRRVVMVDDSIVRGTTVRQVVQMLKNAGARELHLIITCPPFMYPDFYGINTPDQSELIGAVMSIEQMRKYLGADSLHFLSFDGMIKATGLPANKFSTSCFDGVYPIDIGERAKGIKIIKTGAQQHKPVYNDSAVNFQPVDKVKTLTK